MGDKRATLLFRVDAFNAFNRVNLGSITADMANLNFEKVTCTGLSTFVLGAKIRFYVAKHSRAGLSSVETPALIPIRLSGSPVVETTSGVAPSTPQEQ